MKTIKNIVSGIQKRHCLVGCILLACACLQSCKKFIEIPPPTTQLITSTVFSNDAAATSAMLAIYKLMVSNGESLNMSKNNGLVADELTNYSSSPFSLGPYRNALNATDGFGPWQNAYIYIYQANAVIEGLQKNAGVSLSVKQQLTGEAKFIRAFWHFYLTNCYGAASLQLTTDYIVNEGLARTPRMQVLQQIITDLTDAQQLLSDQYVDATSITSTPDRVRPNKMVATALLARAYLYFGDYDSKNVNDYKNAEVASTSVISNSQYSLISPLTNSNYVFNISNNAEAIWQLATPLPANNGATRDGQTYVLISKPTNVSLSQQLIGSFEAGDNRKNIWVGSFTASGVTYSFANKYKTRTGSTIAEYVMVLRLAEQYLIRAEARAQQGNTSGAIADLNIIRNRAGLANYAGPTDQASLLTAILHERQVEFFCEWGHRWFDLNRTGNTNSVMSIVTPQKGGIWSSDGHQLLFPIRSIQISLDPNLSQNPGY